MDLLSKLEELSVIINGYGDNSLKSEIGTLRDKVAENKLYVVVVGLFKRGKSTLINSLLEKNILPASVTPVTALITIVEYNEKPGAKVHFIDGQIKVIEISIVEEYVTEEKNPDNKKKVHYVRIFDNAEILKSITLVDTPGLGSAYEHNTQATLAFIPKIDAALFLLSADIPISTIDLKLLEELKLHITKIIFVFNKADLLEKEDLQKLVQHNKTVLSKALQQNQSDVKFHIVSNKYEGNNNLTGLKNELQSLGGNEKEALLKSSSSHQLKLLCRQAVLQIQFIADAYLLPLNELESRRSHLTASIQLMNEQKDEFESIVNGKIKLLQQNIHDDVNDESNALQAIISNIIKGVNDTNKLTLHALQKQLDDIIITTFDHVKNEWELKAKVHFKHLLQQYGQRSQSFLHELSENLSAYLGQSLELFSEQFDLNAYTSFYLTLDSGLSAVDNTLSFFDRLFSSSFQRRKIYSKWQQHYNELIVRNTASIIYDLIYKIQESFRKFNYDLTGKMNNILKHMERSVEEVIANKTKTEILNANAIKDIGTRLNQLKTFNS
jgi:small GTP-binding protein